MSVAPKRNARVDAAGDDNRSTASAELDRHRNAVAVAPRKRFRVAVLGIVPEKHGARTRHNLERGLKLRNLGRRSLGGPFIGEIDIGITTAQRAVLSVLIENDPQTVCVLVDWVAKIIVLSMFRRLFRCCVERHEKEGRELLLLGS